MNFYFRTQAKIFYKYGPKSKPMSRAGHPATVIPVSDQSVVLLKPLTLNFVKTFTEVFHVAS